VWLLGRHKLYCADPTDSSALGKIIGTDVAVVSFLTVARPSNFTICDSGGRRQTAEQRLVDYLLAILSNAQCDSRDGALIYLSATWRQIGAVLEASRQLSLEPVDLCVWVDSGVGSGSGENESSGLYQGNHELVFVFRTRPEPSSPTAPSRSRTNTWNFPRPPRKKAQMSLERLLGRQCPVQMIAEAIIEASQTGAILIGCCDSFGTTLVAAEKTGRVARIVEMDPQQCDLIVRRFMAYTSGTAQLAETGHDFESVALERVEQETEFSAAANKSE
jgi:hypothetical protein